MALKVVRIDSDKKVKVFESSKEKVRVLGNRKVKENT